MKKFFLTVAAVAALSISAGATPLAFVCSPSATFAGATGGPTTVTCSADAGAGNTISNLVVRREADALFVLSGTPTVSVDWTGFSGGLSGNDIVPFVFNTSGSAFQPAVPTSPVDFSAGNFGQTLTWTANVSSSISGGTAVQSFGLMSFNFTATPTGVPEPGTMALLGSALVGLGVVARRRKQ